MPIITYLPFIQKFFTLNKHKTYDVCLLIADSVGLGVFTVMGLNAGFDTLVNPNFFTAVFLGVITGVGGGILRDVMAMNLPKVFIKHFYACASILGAMVTFLARLYFSTLVASILGIVVVITLRVLASLLRWTLPKPKYQFEQ